MDANRLRLPAASLCAPTPSLQPIHLLHWRPYYYSTSPSDSVRCRSRPEPDVRKPNWDAAAAGSKFYPYSELYDDEEEGGGFRQQRSPWWSDDDDDDDDADDMEDEDDGFWGFKILRVFGWMVPAVLISMLLGTGPNALFMAVALPLGQTALSLAVDKVWGMAGQTSKPWSRNKIRSKPFPGTSSTNRARKRKQDADFVRSRGSTSSPPSTDAECYETAPVNGRRASTSFGGWDELDRDVEVTPKPNLEEGEQKRQKKSNKISNRVRNRDSPLLIRLLVAVFPLLGSWARFL